LILPMLVAIGSRWVVAFGTELLLGLFVHRVEYEAAILFKFDYIS
jgi:hypothetical protein